MKTLKLHKNLLATAVGAALALGMTTNALASAGVFTVTPSSLGGPAGTFNSDFINGTSSELLQGTPGGVGVGTFTVGANTANTLSGNYGYIDFGTFALAGSNILPITTGLGLNYQLYVTFNDKSTLATGTFGAAGSTYNINYLNFQVWADTQASSATNRTLFNQASTPSTPATITDRGIVDTLLGSGHVLPGGLAGLTTGGTLGTVGAYINSTTTYANTIAGSLFFTQPNPFYNLAFNEFNNTGQGVTFGANCAATPSTSCTIAITNASGGVDFNRVPEPATLGLLGLGLLGMGASLRKRKAG